MIQIHISVVWTIIYSECSSDIEHFFHEYNILFFFNMIDFVVRIMFCIGEDCCVESNRKWIIQNHQSCDKLSEDSTLQISVWPSVWESAEHTGVKVLAGQ